ncbi:T9SS type A sorting domain-containing protein [bacterium]|nr:T9SS type A sorting domain-containing protein [bacterium]
MRLLSLLLLLVFIISINVNAQEINGELYEVDDKIILKVWGNHYERGYAHGYLLAEKVKQEVEGFFIGRIFSNDSTTYNEALEYFQQNFEIEQKYQDEVQGISDGLLDAEIDLYCRVLNRDIQSQDILAFAVFPDMAVSGLFGNNANFGCSTLSNWGECTRNDEELQGNLVVTRALDGHMAQLIDENHTMIVHFPSEETEVPWANICFPGMVATFSCINQHGIGAFQNYGAFNRIVDEENLHPTTLSIRNGIEVYDLNDDGEFDPFDIGTALEQENSLTPWIITTVCATEGIIVETNNQTGTAIRTEENNTVIPENSIAATNHFRVLREPVNCNRYSGISDSLEVNSEVTIDRNWEILRGAAGLNTNTHFIQYVPSLNLLRWASAPDRNTPGHSQEPTVFDLEELFTRPSSVQCEVVIPDRFDMMTYPNPFNSHTTISYGLGTPSPTRIAIYDLTGREIVTLVNGKLEAGYYNVVWDASALPSGLYICRMEACSYTNSIKLVLTK